MGSGVMIYTPSFIEISWGTQKLMEWGIHTQHKDRLNLLSSFQDKGIRLKTRFYVVWSPKKRTSWKTQM
jgi:hypothetical protein